MWGLPGGVKKGVMEKSDASKSKGLKCGATGGSGDGQQKPASQLLEPDGERIDPGHNLNALHNDVFSPPRRRGTGASSVMDDDDDDHYNDRDQQKIKTTKISPGQESPPKKPKSAHHHPHINLPHVPHFKTNKKHAGGGRRNDCSAVPSSTRRIEETLSKESSAREVSTFRSGTGPPPPSAEPSSSSLHSSASTSSDGVRASHPHEHGINALLHSPILTRSTKAIGKLAHATPHMPHIPELPHLHLLPNRGPSVEASLSALNLEDTSITSILEHMRKHPDHVKVQERGCARLTSLAKQRDHMQEITDARGIEIILNAARNHNDDTELLSQSFSALGNISALNSENKQKIAHLQGIETIVSSMRAHAYDPVLQERACGLLFNLSFDHRVSQRLSWSLDVFLLV